MEWLRQWDSWEQMAAEMLGPGFRTRCQVEQLQEARVGGTDTHRNAMTQQNSIPDRTQSIRGWGKSCFSVVAESRGRAAPAHRVELPPLS